MTMNGWVERHSNIRQWRIAVKRAEHARVAQRPRAEPLGGSGPDNFIVGQIDGQFIMRLKAARRVGSSELLGCALRYFGRPFKLANLS